VAVKQSSEQASKKERKKERKAPARVPVTYDQLGKKKKERESTVHFPFLFLTEGVISGVQYSCSTVQYSSTVQEIDR